MATNDEVRVSLTGESLGARYAPTVSHHLNITNLRQVQQTCTEDNEVFAQYRKLAEEVVRAEHPYPENRFEGRGIVTVAGGHKYFPPAWVMMKMLRKHGCKLPIQIYYLGKPELTESMATAAAEVGAELVDAHKIANHFNLPKIGGWQSKVFSIITSRFREVLFLDGDNVPVANPEYLFDSPEYAETGAMFWPDYSRLGSQRTIWKICGLEYRDEPEIESGQILLDKARCWRPLQVTLHMNMNAEFYYQHIWGDKDTFHMAWRMCGQEYHMIRRPIHALQFTMCQHDPQGKRLFQHRNLAKWSMTGQNPRIQGFLFEEDCLDFLQQYGRFCQWMPVIGKFVDNNPDMRGIRHDILDGNRKYELLFPGVEYRPAELELRPDQTVRCLSLPTIGAWHLMLRHGKVWLTLHFFDTHMLELELMSKDRWEGFYPQRHCGIRLQLKQQ
jgi:hypothetical protein